MAWPSATIGTTNLDGSTDSPATARADLKSAVDAVNDIIGSRAAANGVASLDASTLLPTAQLPTVPVSKGGTGSTSAADARTALGLGSAATLTAGTAANNAVQLDASAKLPAVDGSQLTGLPARNLPERQTVLSGPTDSSGLPSFLPASSGTLSLTTSGLTTTPLIVTAAGGYASSGSSDRTGQATAELTWSSLSASSTVYLYIDVAADGTLTTGSTTLAPTYQWGGTYSTTNGQFTYNIQEATAKTGNGSTAAQVWRVFVGEAVTSGSGVTSTRAYAYQGRYSSPQTSIAAAGTITTVNHNLGVQPRNIQERIVCTTAELGFSIGDEVSEFGSFGGGITSRLVQRVGRTSLQAIVRTGSPNAIWIQRPDTGAAASITTSSWRWVCEVSRGW